MWELSAAAQGVLPSSVGDWTTSGVAPTVSAEQLDSVAGERAGLLREFGLNSAEQRQYRQGQQTASITLYRMADPSAAYGVFTFLREPQMRPLDLGDSVSFAAATGDSAVFVVGNLALLASAVERPPDAWLTEIAATLLPHADSRPYPLIADFLPRGGIVPGSERYVLGPRALREALPWAPATGDDWLGFGKSAEAVVARYQASGQTRGGEITLLVTNYPTRQVAADQFGSLNRWMAFNVEADQAGGRRVVFGSRSNALVALVFGAESREIAGRLLSQIEYRSTVTWNEPSHTLTDPSFPTMIVGVFQGTGLIMLLAVAAGIGFGGLRVLVKFFVPGRVFDRDSQIEILQLGLSSKPIDSRDFY